MQKWIKLSQYARNLGLSYRTAHNHYKSGKIPHEIKVLPTGSILICIDESTYSFTDRDCIIYCRVSSPHKKDDLKRQAERCEEYAAKNGFKVLKVYKEVASGMNDNRRELNKILEECNNTKFTLIVENKDRLTRFGFNYLQTYFKNMDCKINVMNVSETEQQDLIKDLVSVMTSFCCRLYGLRKGGHKARHIKNEILHNCE